MSSEVASHQEPKRRARIKSLDGIRAIAVLMVLISHGVNAHDVELPMIDGTPIAAVIRGLGRCGVMLFFVLSGYLITTLLLNEHHDRGRVSLSRFWYRRAIRIFPVFYAYLAVIALLTQLGVFRIELPAFVVAASYLWNYQFVFLDYRSIGASASSVLGHLWTLCVEEQFYVLFPLVFAKLSHLNTFRLLVLLILATPAIRLGQYALFASSREFGTTMGHTMFGVSVAIGCAWSLAERLGIRELSRDRLIRPACVILAAGYLFIANPVASNALGGKWALPLGESLAGFSAMILIAAAVRHADTSRVGVLLNHPLAVWIGSISYSLYIWQQLPYSLQLSESPALVERTLLGTAAVGLACVSYYGIERPFQLLRDYRPAST